MSEALARTQTTVAARLSLSMQDYRDLVKRPLLALPPEARTAALNLWVCNQHLKGLESAMPLTARFSVWIDRHGLAVDDAITVMNSMLSPTNMQCFEFSGQLMTKLAAEVAMILDRRRKEKERAEFAAREAQRVADRASPAQLKAVRDQLSQIGAFGD
ncbi:hypothetical protein [Limnoglobus roseus]|uniref:Uncharacterized protein n=1 Tax=Limnoglobus roseus TaxID=2598579 RepID=A0A5C1A768_9BACT|nr:hypothetical protein [Limnoglobus roseus]QEL14037.1 hypothetical protein PX52LOC_00900 [Limnoglobus roseus]